MSVRRKGFTLLEILLVIGLIAILAGGLILAINPAKQLADARNVQRRQDVNTIVNALYQYAIDHNGSFPGAIASSSTCNSSAAQEICGTTTATSTNCVGMTDLSDLAYQAKYLPALPRDPTVASTNTNGSRYYVVKNSDNRLVVCAPNAEQSATISVIK
jgi:prepilin-type N-terminal cleavage/methylation domain-containing protein